jgi:hypothetical protein
MKKAFESSRDVIMQTNEWTKTIEDFRLVREPARDNRNDDA